MNKTERLEIIIIIILIAVFGSTLIIAKTMDNNVEEEIIDNTVSPLKEVNRYFTIDSAISKYTSYVANSDTSSIIKTLSSDYIDANGITLDNVFDYITSYGSNYTSSTREIYQISSHNNVYKYYAKVRISSEDMDTSNVIGYEYFEVTIDEENLTFSIEPISEVIYQDKIGEVESNG